MKPPFSGQMAQVASTPFAGQHIVEVAKDHAAGVFSGTNDVIEHITGKKPMGLEEFVRQHRAAFE